MRGASIQTTANTAITRGSLQREDRLPDLIHSVLQVQATNSDTERTGIRGVRLGAHTANSGSSKRKGLAQRVVHILVLATYPRYLGVSVPFTEVSPRSAVVGCPTLLNIRREQALRAGEEVWNLPLFSSGR